MSIEATLICIDNSEYSRNGDFVPTRLGAQMDAVGLIASAKLAEQFENSVGIVCLAGKGSRLLSAPSNDLGLFLSDLHMLQPHGDADFLKGIQTAQLALKHRLNKSQKQRIICFVASPIKEPIKHFVALGKMLKKNNVTLDIVNLYNDNNTQEKLKALHAAVNNNNNSNYLSCQPGGNVLLSELIVNSPIMNGNIEAVGTGSFSRNLTDFGVDPEMDPQLYMALRMSLEQEEERLRREAMKNSENEGKMTLSEVENALAGLEGLELIPLSTCIEMLSTSEGNPELIESLIYSLVSVEPSDHRIQVSVRHGHLAFTATR
ncbi:bifunctional Ubiquitin interacting motif/von Willebrand factor A-like domain superfamily/von Willebrand factor [Babesia duncani]|uniref:Bifunctional Ubiquitin interacting motif/von Willebrand factor A-like domain superfamily/von Willebrand factor n=1 Tax=Babesia duncani TaxID=323732 RepID=A0AAD9PNU7_9APIC|nr:bifunctional Ubiquitin interacting motif/von Willebrand factor A-like domain superfamily/von Willebrand factor [Babesia duncani]